MARGLAPRDELERFVRVAFGPGRRLAGVQRLRGGSKKGVYRLSLDDGGTVIGYIWVAAENYWPAPRGPVADAGPFGEASGAGLFEAASARLEAVGVRTPRVYLLDRTLAVYPAEIALVEDVPGGTLEQWLERGEPGAEQVLARLAAALSAIHGCRGSHIGRVAQADSGPAPASRPCEQIVLDRALGHLAEAASRVERVAAVRGELEAVTADLAAATAPRADYRMIHGELGPDHVLIDERGEPVLIDIEGVMFFDVEWEHVFLRLRFGEHYGSLHADGLDEERLRFYGLAMHLSLIAGPLRLLDGDFPDRGPMMRIVEYNIEKALAFVS
jgi:Phosphotransferase enzyme family